MTDISAKYGSSTAMTITIASLGSTNLRNSTSVDNSSTKHVDALVGGKIKTGGSGTSATGYVNVYAYGSTDDGTTYSGDASGTDAAYSGASANLRLIGVISAVANSTTYIFGPYSVASAFGGVLPKRWGVVLENRTGATLSSTGSDHAVTYQGVKGEF